MSRGCGSCTLCCTLMAVQMEPLDEPAKPAGTPCSHCTRKGCSIYDARPDACRQWSCLWLQTQNDFRAEPLEKQLRPDRTGVVLDVNGKGNIIAHCDKPASWRREPMRSFLISLASRTHVLLEHGLDSCSQLMPDGSTRELKRIGVDEDSNEVKYVVKGGELDV